MDKQTDRQNFLSKTRPLLWKGLSKKTFYIDLLNLRVGGAPSSLVNERLSTEQAHFLLPESLLFTKMSHLIFARAGNARFNKVRHSAPMLCISIHSFTDV